MQKRKNTGIDKSLMIQLGRATVQVPYLYKLVTCIVSLLKINATKSVTSKHENLRRLGA